MFEGNRSSSSRLTNSQRRRRVCVSRRERLDEVRHPHTETFVRGRNKFVLLLVQCCSAGYWGRGGGIVLPPNSAVSSFLHFSLKGQTERERGYCFAWRFFNGDLKGIAQLGRLVCLFRSAMCLYVMSSSVLRAACAPVSPANFEGFAKCAAPPRTVHFYVIFHIRIQVYSVG